MLCNLCNDIFSGREGLYPYPGGRLPRQHTNILSFCQSVEENCYICTKSWNRFISRHLGDLEAFKSNFRKTWYTLEAMKSDQQAYYEIAIFLDTKNGSFEVDLNTITFMISTDFNHLVNSDVISTSTASEESWSIVTYWFARCTTDHERCNKSAKDRHFLPTRLIDLGSDSQSLLHLVHTSTFGALQEYMSLSHCWGSTSVLKLTGATRKDLEAGFDVSILPETYRDVVAVVRRFEVRYLWIDSLCILQDSADDWQKEASMMKDVYQNSQCNIASTAASNAEESMFVERDPLMVQTCTMTTEWSIFRDKKNIIVDENLWTAGVSEAPLNRRGWVIQERLLAPRVLHFGKEQLFWECHELDACETFPHGMPPMFQGTRFKGVDPEIDGERARMVKSRDLNLALSHDLRSYFVWHRILSEYRNCALSHSQDKLIAISGIVKEMQKQSGGDEYLAGLWRRHLVPELLWSCLEDYAHSGEVISKRPLEYRAPSWSWASIDGGGYSESPTNGDHMVSILDAQVTLVTADVTGQIKDAFIRLRGCLILVSIEREKMKVNGESLGPNCNVSMDVPIESINEPIYALPVLQQNEKGEPYIYGLLLQSTGKRQGEYSRQGFWWTREPSNHHFEEPGAKIHYHPDLYEEGSSSTIVLV